MRVCLLRLFAVLAVGCLCFLSPADAVSGPIREFIRDHRPGIIIPKREAPSCGSRQAFPAPAPAPISDPGLDISPYPQSGAVRTFVPPNSGAGSSCPGGSCPVPQQRFVFPRK